MNSQTKIPILILTILLLSLPTIISSASTESSITASVTILSPNVTATPAPQIIPSSPSSSSGSSGSGVVSDEPITNIKTFDRNEQDISISRDNLYKFSRTDIYEISLSPLNNENDVTMRVEQLISKPAKISQEPGDSVYSYINIFSGTKRIKSATVRFRVPFELMYNKQVKLMRWDNFAWTELPTKLINFDGNYSYYESTTPGFSSFAIVYKAIIPVETITANQIAPESSTIQQTTILPLTPVEHESKKTTMIAIIIAVIASLIAVLLLFKKKA